MLIKILHYKIHYGVLEVFKYMLKNVIHHARVVEVQLQMIV